MTSRLVIVGGGPRAFMLLERIVARAAADTGVPADVHIDIVDPHPAGAGRIWRRAQSPLLKLNSMAQDVTVFTDETCSIEGPVVAGPSLIEWVQQWRDGRLGDVEIDDELVATEARALTGTSFPTRRLQSHYLEWFARRVIASAPEGVFVRTHVDEVLGVHRAGPRWDVTLASGARLTADAVVYAIGHTAEVPAADEPAAVLADAARRAGLDYYPPAFTADLDLDGIPAGSEVIVRGMGLAAVDLVVLLTQGRGGRFETTADGLRYVPSGHEPRLHLGSRRGVPYRSKVSSQIQGDAPRRDVLTPSVIAALAASDDDRLLDFERDAWPLIAAELLHGYYRELFTGHPERVSGTWKQAAAILAEHAWDDPALHAALAALVPDPLDRLDIAALDRPLAGARFADADDAHAAVATHIRADLHLRTAQERSAAQGLFFAMLLSFLALSEIPAERWNARSRAELLPVRWHTFFSYVASGPPAHRLEEFLALADAGVVRFLGPDVRVALDASSTGSSFVASSPSHPGATTASILIDAWLPSSAAATSESAALRQLATVHGRLLRVADGEKTRSLGRVVVDGDGRVLGADGAPHDALFAIGPFTSHPEGGAFTRPRSDALSFRQSDRVAAAVVAALTGSALSVSELSAPAPA
ncbi:FAD/NAD(P)-binding protein [Microbacterium laevaniformans]|uniref:FAD/NAD(P)-binding protein n=1 Tax=Microbacterium laevaniformans TaxID=36807 RepID=UPI00363C3FE4